MPRAKATHCPQGHVYDEANTYVDPVGKRHCRTCGREHIRRSKARHPERKRERERRWRQENPEKMAVIRLRQRVKAVYGLTLEEYEAILARGCAICGAETALVMDHCHTSGKVRDALCNGCNAGLGMFGEDPARLAAAIDYLREHGGPSHS